MRKKFNNSILFGFLWLAVSLCFGACSLDIRQDNETVPSRVAVHISEDMLERREASDMESISEGTIPTDGEDVYSFTEGMSRFAYDSLSESEKIWYGDIARILGRMQEKQKLSDSGLEEGLNENSIDKIFQCVMNDHPEYFYVEGYTYTVFTQADKLVKIEFSGTYGVDMEEAQRRREEIKAEAGEILAGAEGITSNYEKVKYVYEALIRNTDYDLNAPDNQNIYSVFANRSSVCQGYAKAAQYLLNRLGVECTMVMGTVDTGEGHAWNLVNVDGSYYYLDATWGDASYRTEEGEEQEKDGYLPQINYDYLCVTTEQLLRTHTLGGVVPMPLCVAMEANYYVREGAYFKSYDEEQLARVFTAAIQQGKSDATLKCADMQTFLEISDMLIDKQGIFQFWDSMEGVVAYAQNEKQLSMTFWMTNE